MSPLTASECVSVLEPYWVITVKMGRFSLGRMIKVHEEGQVGISQKEGLAKSSESCLCKFWSSDKQTNLTFA